MGCMIIKETKNQSTSNIQQQLRNLNYNNEDEIFEDDQQLQLPQFIEPRSCRKNTDKFFQPQQQNKSLVNRNGKIIRKESVLTPSIKQIQFT